MSCWSQVSPRNFTPFSAGSLMFFIVSTGNWGKSGLEWKAMQWVFEVEKVNPLAVAQLVILSMIGCNVAIT